MPKGWRLLSDPVIDSRLKNKMGRKRKWTPHVLSQSEKVASRMFAQAWLSSTNANRIRADYRVFLNANQLEDNDAAKLLIVGQMIMAGLKMSSICTYLGYVVYNNDRNSVWRAVRLAHADEETRHAVDATGNRLTNLIRAMPTGPIECVTWLMFNTGARNMDLRRLRRKQIDLNVDDRTVTIEFRITKGIRSRAKRRTVVFQWRSTPTPRVCELLIDGNEDARPLLDVDVARTNSALKKVDSDSHSRTVTSYSFRRNFINDLIKTLYSPAYSHKENLEFIASRTLHNDPQVIEAFYKKSSSSRTLKKEQAIPLKEKRKRTVRHGV